MAEDKESRLRSFFRGVKVEWGKIIWPSKNTLAKQTGAVVVVSVILSAIIAILDYLMKSGLDKLLTISL
ncbi:MAG: preprotein translocase subunit SecE [Lachnospiraceae bacterium]|jgi:preprotein translocase subunit SecE|uniref:Protein translocase subunit SecE n=1 Tax=Porcincola intestinalis TaxID=2606632 RepID=A0A6L5X2J8_9FIRM|nr:preprotein translocase subunit SecE [Porcincola intestinalis]MCI6238757.1 preprotein translocase subunit SecE [Lachnospiraceae bacterium]MCI6697993.1 preprotein translocase subunit SecE [Lachnospiraceae bacterium]MCI7093183.1 preprotein translocase subunit SecE [Lachnospiraceae bacterium]MDD6438847.1 preprotein translocase subunit SecE [Lachnospiraceae bacterium]MDY4204047.1 preprotein translocase subunit SecE [Porcincola intestinalis]